MELVLELFGKFREHQEVALDRQGTEQRLFVERQDATLYTFIERLDRLTGRSSRLETHTDDNESAMRIRLP